MAGSERYPSGEAGLLASITENVSTSYAHVAENRLYLPQEDCCRLKGVQVGESTGLKCVCFYTSWRVLRSGSAYFVTMMSLWASKR